MTQPAIYNSPNSDYTPECETQGDGTQRQVMKLAEIASGVILTTNAPVSSAGSAPTFATIGTSTTTALASNASRKGCVLVNDSANVIYLSFNGSAVSGRGIRLNANGGSFTMTPQTYTTAQISAIATGASSNLGVQEFT